MTTRQALGEELRRAREQRGITLEHISELTKISVALFAGLERGDCSRWPGGIYSRAYIREYAQAVGLDRDETTTRFCECFTETAFPDGRPNGKTERTEAKDVRPVVTSGDEPLRLTITEEPQEHRRELARRAVTVILDVVLSVALAAALNVAIGAGFWMALAGVSVCCHVLGVVRGRAHAADLLAHLSARRHAPRPKPAATETILAEAA